MTKLIILESPEKAKHIQSFCKELKVEAIALASVGHIRELKDTGLYNIGINDKFEPIWQNSEDKKDIIQKIINAAKQNNVNEILLATDPDREGEAIAWHLAEILKMNKVNKPIKRMKLNAITKQELELQLNHLDHLDIQLVNAAITRAILDKIFGYRLSKIVQKEVGGKSAGRVQSAVLLILAQIEQEIKNFKKSVSFGMTGKTENDLTFNLYNQTNELFKVEENEKAVLEDKLEDFSSYLNPLEITKIEVKEFKDEAVIPLKTSTALKLLNSSLELNTNQATQALQKLYENGYITYIRTDSTEITEEVSKNIVDYLNTNFKDLEIVQPKVQKEKNAQEGHPAITPTDITMQVLPNNQEYRDVYRLIWETTIVAFCKPHFGKKYSIRINCNNPEQEYLQATIKEYDSYSYLDNLELTFYKKPKSKNCKYQEEDLISLKFEIKEYETKPKSRFSQASLIEELEKRGIGRPSTFHNAVSVNLKRGYGQLEKKDKILVNNLGLEVNNFLQTNFSDIISISYTAKMEEKLDQIAKGKCFHKAFIKEIYDNLDKKIESHFAEEKNNSDKEICPKCDVGILILRVTKNGKQFKGCSTFPTCDFIKWPDSKLNYCFQCQTKGVFESIAKNGTKYQKCKNCDYIQFDNCKTKKR